MVQKLGREFWISTNTFPPNPLWFLSSFCSGLNKVAVTCWATCGCGRWGVGRRTEVLWEHGCVYMWTWDFEIWIYTPSGSRAGLKKLETGLIKKKKRGVLFRESVWGAGGRDPFNLPWDTGTRVPLPWTSPDLCELDPGEQCKKRGGGKGSEGSEGRQEGGGGG